MSVRIQQLNADTTFLISFFPPFASQKLSRKFPSDFTILIDPWLKGYASILHPSFQISHHTSTPALHSLKDLQQNPDIIIISQDKPDHCHKETLCSFPQSSDTSILATPAAARKIRSWGHFDEEHIHDIDPYDPYDENAVIRIPLSAYSSNSADGEITIANIPAKRDVTGLHNAIGITYQPPSTILTVEKRSRKSNGSTLAFSENGISSAPSSRQRSRATSSASRPNYLDPLGTFNYAESLSLSPVTSRTDSGVASDISQQPNQEQVLSIIYTPHGIQPRMLEPYVRHHLVELDALPVLALLHSLTVEDNPWFMGGRVAAGAPGGMDIVKRIGVKHWIGAHDEEKLNKGMATVLIKSQRYDTEDVEDMLHTAGLLETKVHQLDVGEALRLPELEHAGEKGRRIWKGAGKGLSMGKGQRMNVEDNVLAMPEPKRPMTAPAAAVAEGINGAVAPGTKMRIRREITHPEGMWI